MGAENPPAQESPPDAVAPAERVEQAAGFVRFSKAILRWLDRSPGIKLLALVWVAFTTVVGFGYNTWMSYDTRKREVAREQSEALREQQRQQQEAALKGLDAPPEVQMGFVGDAIDRDGRDEDLKCSITNHGKLDIAEVTLAFGRTQLQGLVSGLVYIPPPEPVRANDHKLQPQETLTASLPVSWRKHQCEVPGGNWCTLEHGCATFYECRAVYYRTADMVRFARSDFAVMSEDCREVRPLRHYVLLGEVDRDEPARLPWKGDPSLLPFVNTYLESWRRRDAVPPPLPKYLKEPVDELLTRLPLYQVSPYPQSAYRPDLRRSPSPSPKLQ